MSKIPEKLFTEETVSSFTPNKDSYFPESIFLPPWKEGESFQFFILPTKENDNQVVYPPNGQRLHSLNRFTPLYNGNYPDRCYICEKVSQFYYDQRSGKPTTEEEKKHINRIQSRTYFLTNIVLLDDPDNVRVMISKYYPKPPGSLAKGIRDKFAWGISEGLRIFCAQYFNMFTARVVSHGTYEVELSIKETPFPRDVEYYWDNRHNLSEILNEIVRDVPYNKMKEIYGESAFTIDYIDNVEEDDRTSKAFGDLEKEIKPENTEQEDESVESEDNFRLPCFGENYDPKNKNCIRCNDAQDCIKAKTNTPF